MMRRTSIGRYVNIRRKTFPAVIAALLVFMAPTLAWAALSEDSPPTSWVVSAAANGRATESATIATSWRTPTNNYGLRILDTEIYNAGGNKVAQWYVWRDVQPGKRINVRFSWYLAGVADGTYTVKQGVFERDWSRTIAWNNQSATVKVVDHRVVARSASAPTTTATTTSTTAPSVSPVSSTTSTTQRPAAPPVATNNGNALAGATFFGGIPEAAQQAQTLLSSNAHDAALLQRLASIPTATWLGNWNANVRADVASVVAAATAQNKVPVFVAYNIPSRDCGSYSAGGVGSESAYNGWISEVAAGIGSAKAVVIVEPDALAQLCGDTSARYRMLGNAVTVLERNAATATYLDAGHSNWVDANTMIDRLRQAGVAKADGFALNVSNFQTTSASTAYGETLSAGLGGKHYVVDTGRNGNGANGEWCNPSGRKLGAEPTTTTGVAHADAFLWVKVPGESDGNCNGGPGAGTFWRDYALSLARAAWG